METSTPSPSNGDSPAGEVANTRRAFLTRTATFVLGGAGLLVPAVTAVVAFLNPLGQKSRAGSFLPVTSLDVLPEDGTPRRFPVIGERTDAWNRYPKEPIGAVYLRRTDNPEKPVLALHTRCPHAGCPLQYRATPDGPQPGEFFCPCHSNPRFDLSGELKETPSGSPRRMDELDVDPQALQNGEVQVRFVNFRPGISDPVERP